METKNFVETMDVTMSGIDAYKKMVIATNLIPLGMMAETMDSLAKACKMKKQYYIKYDPLGLSSLKQRDERHPITEEGFYSIGKTIQGEDLFLKNGRMFVAKDETKIINPMGYNVATMASSTLRTMMQGITCTIDALEQTAKNMKFFMEFASFCGRK